MVICTCNQDGSIDTCPVTKQAWEARAEKAKCRYENVYHCLSDSEGKKWENCVQKTLILQGNCPVFTSDGYLNWKPCNISEPSCPNSSYVSNEVYKYPMCYGDNIPKNQTLKVGLDHDGSTSRLIIGIVVPAVLLILAVVFICMRSRRKQMRLKNSIRRLVDDYATEPFLSAAPVDDLVAISRKDVINAGVQKLLDESVKSICIIGGLGYSMTPTARSILEMYAMRNNWSSRQYQFPDMPNDVKENTIIFIYGWFGLWNDDMCSVDTAKERCAKLLQMVKTTTNMKVIIGMRKELYDKYSKYLNEYNDLFANSFSLDCQSISDVYSYHFKNMKENCNVRDCPCCGLTIDNLSNGEDKFIGLPLKVEIISKHHDSVLIKSYLNGKGNILAAMTEHFTALKKSEKPIYEWIMYICLKGHYLRSEPFDRNLIRNMDFEIKYVSFDRHRMRLSKYIRMGFCETQSVSKSDVKYVFWHPIIYISAFHSLYKSHKDIVMEHCNLDAILQLVRPLTYGKTKYNLEVSADETDVKQLRERLSKEGLEEKYKDHPLFKVNSS